MASRSEGLQTESEEVVPLNVDYILDGLNEAAKFCGTFKGKDGVLVMGVSGVGKSAFCNYMLGHEMQRVGFRDVDTVQPTDIKIGHDSDSETSIVKGYPLEDIDSTHIFCLLDTAGFGDTRHEEVSVINFGSMEMAIRAIRQVKAFVIIIPLEHLLQSRANGLRKLFQELVLLLKDPVDMVQNAIIVVTKWRNDPTDQLKLEIKDKMEKLVASYKKKLEVLTKGTEFGHLSSSDDMTAEEYCRIIALGTIISKNVNKLVFFDPLDGGTSRCNVLKLISGIEIRKWYSTISDNKCVNEIKKTLGYNSKMITINDFRFKEGNKDRQKLNDAVYHRTQEGYEFIKSVQQNADMFIESCTEISRCETQLDAWKQVEGNLTETLQNPEREERSNQQLIKSTQFLIEQTSRDLVSHKSQLKKIEAETKQLEDALQKIDTDDETFFKSDDLLENVPWYWPFGYRVKHFSFTTGDPSVSFARIRGECRNGSFEKEIEEYEKDLYEYSNTYTSHRFARPAYSEITVYIRKRDAAGNKANINRLRRNIAEKERESAGLKSEISELEANIDVSKKWVESTQKNDKEKLLEKLTESRRNIATYEAKLRNALTGKEEYRARGLDALQDFNGARLKFDAVKKISQLLEFQSSSVKEFVADFQEFEQHIDEYLADFDASAEILTSNLSAADTNIVLLTDPITKKPIKDVVVTQDGTAFDVVSLLQQFDLTQNPPPPFKFTKEDGSVEEIPYMGWSKVRDIQAFLERLKEQSAAQKQEVKFDQYKSMTKEELENYEKTIQKEMDLRALYGIERTFYA